MPLSPRREGERPNLVLVYPDQMRGQAMGFLGIEPVLTPNLDMPACCWGATRSDPSRSSTCGCRTTGPRRDGGACARGDTRTS